MTPTSLPRHWSAKALVWLSQIQADHTITDFGLRVAVVLATQADPDRLGTEISLTDLAKACGATRAGVSKAIAALHAKLHLNVERTGAENGTPARYGLRIWTQAMPFGVALVKQPKSASRAEGERYRARNAAHVEGEYRAMKTKLSSVRLAALRDAEMRDRRGR